MDKEFREMQSRLAESIRNNKRPEFENNDERSTTEDYKTVLNYFEFIAAGVRNGDFDETLLKDSFRGTIVKLFEICESEIWSLRNRRERQSIYEHIQWLHGRWTKKPSRTQKALKFCRGKPFAGKKFDHHG